MLLGVDPPFPGLHPVTKDRLGPLLENAARHARRRVALSADLSPDGALALHVDDDGPGLSADRAEVR